MPSFIFEISYVKAYVAFIKRNKKNQKAIDKALRLFSQNSSHPSLHLEKLAGKNVWTIRIDQGNRMFFFWSETGDTAIFFFVGKHDSYKTI